MGTAKNRVSVTVATEHGFAKFRVEFKSTDDTLQVAQRVYNDLSVILRTMNNLNAEEDIE